MSRLRLQYSIRGLLLLVLCLALALTIVVQSLHHRQERSRLNKQVVELESRLYIAEQTLEKLPVEDPQRVYVQALPSYAHARWAWRIYLPPGRRYALHMDVGEIIGEGDNQRVVVGEGIHDHVSGLTGGGETIVTVQQIPWKKRALLGASVGTSEASVHLTPDVARCLGRRIDYRQERLGDPTTENLAPDERIDLLMHWYPGQGTKSIDGSAPGFSVWLEPQ